ncbi:hypothetical protein CLAFUW4_14775 [Fulvia fulva]|uniref:Uncharacterized protein n=1 Tax=Passalora fulva TaxID=5499 RepID=A0A9Q8PMI3_PASFU|nr:uncharacterized protein CLAFUR5_14602 [Fulvia fulva]KAK4608942.1 hypothetical protein CLAFUR4_14767 [Fulvia fulva]KAK4609797.1 hypothetical protein CLAFUR0_14767 [Fulvia fulva]UJO25275.1 hypothetical protein CLAFUR5_14602 [Fulvia fulva]WPV22448.1 hypothetical protein CLAFUW4_14775 [Fulvia fulva]WPV37365.1 hypothetical protein CLAFUW7_14776 [Fulvia fulva]
MATPTPLTPPPSEAGSSGSDSHTILVYDPEEIKLLEHVKSIPLTMVEAMNNKEWDRAELVLQLTENSKKNPGWRCEAVDVMPHVARRGGKGQITNIEVLINAKHYHTPDRIVRSMCLTLVFASYWNAEKGGYDWLCTKQKIVPGMD